MPTPKKRTERKSPKLSSFGIQLELAMAAEGISKSALAAKIGKGWTTTRVTDLMSATRKKGPTVESVRDLANALRVTSDFLVFGQLPMRRDQLRSTAELHDDLAAEIRRRVHQDSSDLFEGLDPSHIEVNAASLLSDFINYTTAEFIKGAEKALEDAARYGAYDGQVHVISALVSQLPYALQSEAYEAAGVLRVNALANTLGRDAEASGIHLNESGINALLPSQQFDGTDEAVLKLIAIAEEPLRMP